MVDGHVTSSQASEGPEMLYIDANNFYGLAMSQRLPCKDNIAPIFEPLKTILETDDYAEMGFFFEVDSRCPQS